MRAAPASLPQPSAQVPGASRPPTLRRLPPAGPCAGLGILREPGLVPAHAQSYTEGRGTPGPGEPETEEKGQKSGDSEEVRDLRPREAVKLVQIQAASQGAGPPAGQRASSPLCFITIVTGHLQCFQEKQLLSS